MTFDEVLYDWAPERFELLYESFTKRIAIESLDRERAAQLRSIVSNSAYMEAGDEGKAMREAIEDVNHSFDEAVSKITDPRGEQEKIAKEKMMSNPLFAAGIRGFENMRWQMKAGLDPFSKN